MADMRKASTDQVTRRKSAVNWPVWVAAAICIVFVVGVWVNNYRVSHAAAAAAAIAAKK